MPSSGHFAPPIEQADADAINVGATRAMEQGLLNEFWGVFLEAIRDGEKVQAAVNAACEEWDI